MKRIKRVKILTAVLVLSCMVCMSACGGTGSAEKKEELREKLLLAYQYLENMDYDMALDAFAEIIEIDEKQIDAYIGMTRSYSAKGEHAKARETASRGRAALEENRTMVLMDTVYSRIDEHQEELKDLAALLKEGGEKIPGQLQETETDLFSELLEKIWERLDDEDLWEIYSGTGYVIVYPVDPENNEYLLLYPSGYFYLGEVEYVPYSEILAAEEGLEEGEEAVSRDPVIIPAREGYGIMAYVNEKGEIAGFYLGSWENGLPEDSEALFVWQKLSGGARFAWFGQVKEGKFAGASALYGSSDPFLSAALGRMEDGYDLSSHLDLDGVYPFNNGRYDLIYDIPEYPGNIYSGDFLNRDLFERIEAGENAQILKELAQADSPVPIDGDLNFTGIGLTVMGFDIEHGIYILALEGKGFDTPFYAMDAEGNILFQAYEEQIWLTSSGFSGLLITQAGTQEPFTGDAYSAWQGTGEDADIWQIDFDWDGNETGRTYKGQVEDAYSFVRYGGYNAASLWGGDAAASGSRIKAERTGDGFKITDSGGKDCGTIHVDDPDDYTYAINGNMIQIRKSDYTGNYLFQVIPD